MAGPTSICLSSSCRQTVEGSVARCPACGGRMRTPRGVRIGGGVLIVLGLFLVGLMGYISVTLAPSFQHAGEPGNSFTGTPEQARTAMWLFATVIAFGAGALAAGLWQLATGRRSVVVLAIMVVMTLVVLGAMWRTMAVLG